jgi:hypothetical protein
VAMHRHLSRVLKEFQRGLDDAARADKGTKPPRASTGIRKRRVA